MIYSGVYRFNLRFFDLVPEIEQYCRGKTFSMCLIGTGSSGKFRNALL